jgi:hypothetical protein
LLVVRRRESRIICSFPMVLFSGMYLFSFLRYVQDWEVDLVIAFFGVGFPQMETRWCGSYSVDSFKEEEI